MRHASAFFLFHSIVRAGVKYTMLVILWGFLYCSFSLVEFTGKDFLLLLDEIQNVNDWHRWVRTAIDAGLVRTIFITGSPSKLLSGEPAALLTGRYIDFGPRQKIGSDRKER